MTHTHITGFNVFHCNRRPHARVDVYHHGSSGCCGSYGCGGSIWGPQNFGAGFGLGMGYGLMNWLGNMFGFGGGMGGYGMGMGMGYGMPGYGMGGYGMGNGWLNGLFGNRTNPYGQGNDDKDQEKLKEFTEELNDIRNMTDDCERKGALKALKGRLERYQPDSVYGKENDTWKKLIEDTIDLLTKDGLNDDAADLKKKQPAGGTGKVDNNGNDGNGTLTPAQQEAKVAADAALASANTLGDKPTEKLLDTAIQALKDAKDNPNLDNDKKKELQDKIEELEAKKSELYPDKAPVTEVEVPEEWEDAGNINDYNAITETITDAANKTEIIEFAKNGSKQPIKGTVTIETDGTTKINNAVVRENGSFGLTYTFTPFKDSGSGKIVYKITKITNTGSKDYYINKNFKTITYTINGNHIERNGAAMVIESPRTGYELLKKGESKN